MSPPLLTISHLETHFPLRRGWLLAKQVGVVRAVDDVSLHLARGEILGLVGESGCGKSTLARTVMQLTPATAGTVTLNGRDLTSYSRRQLRAARVDCQMIFQDPYASLNPRMTVFGALAEAVRTREPVSGQDLAARVRDLMATVGLAPEHMRRYPHEFSGGQRQRIAIARALAPRPQLVIADEPVSALDVSIQSQIINLLRRLSREMGLALIFISHDLAVVKYIADRIAVMYLGRILELGSAVAVMQAPLHPYTEALVSAIPVPDPDTETARQRIILKGDPPSPLDPPAGCPFHTRCMYAQPRCAETTPALTDVTTGHCVACIRIEEIRGTGRG